MLNAFSVDVEDWYQGIGIPMEEWGRFDKRVGTGMHRLLDLFARHDARATCFILGRTAEEHPDLIREIAAAGHEIATHGYSHTEVYYLTPEEFREEIRRSVGVLQDLTGERVIGYRAPYFTITADSIWALDILVEEGLLYDSSIHPIKHYRYGIPQADRLPSVIAREAGCLLEIPVSTLPFRSTNIPVGGGGYLRLYPYPFWRTCLRRLQRRGETLALYVHPWELDPDHPRIELPRRQAFVHYLNLRSTHTKLDRLFREFRFGSYREAYEEPLGRLAQGLEATGLTPA